MEKGKRVSREKRELTATELEYRKFVFGERTSRLTPFKGETEAEFQGRVDATFAGKRGGGRSARGVTKAALSGLTYEELLVVQTTVAELLPEKAKEALAVAKEEARKANEAVKSMEKAIKG